MNSRVKGKWSVLLSGRLLQFNVSLLILALVLAVMFLASVRSKDLIICYGGTGLAAILLSSVVVFVIKHYGKQQTRPLDGTSSKLAFENDTGAKVTISNPPDSFFQLDEFRSMLRAVIVGANADLVPDGEVIGKAAEGKVRKWSEEEKKRFAEENRKRLQGRKEAAAILLEDDPIVSAGVECAPASDA